MMKSVRPLSWRMLMVVAALLVSALTAAACAQPVLPVTSSPAAGDAEQAASTGEEADETVAPSESADSVDNAAPDVASDEWNGIPVGFTAEGWPFRGDPNAPVTMMEYSDYECPFCARYFVQTEPALNESYVRTGQLRVIFRDFPIEELHPNAPEAHHASLCVAEQGAAAYWDMHAKLFQTQTEWSNSIDPLPVFARLAEEAGADPAAYAECMESVAEKQPMIDASMAAGSAAGVSGTPSFVFSGADGEEYLMVGAQAFDQFALYIDALLKGEAPPVPAAAAEAEAPAEIPFWATAEGWEPDAERPGYNVAGDQYRGDPSAPITIIEFSDFQCPFCQQHVLETQPALDEQYVESGQILWVFKHFPLNIHPQAPAAGAAAECAAEQGKFWEMHEALFADQDQWSIEDPAPVFMALAAELELDEQAFSACLEDGEAAQRVMSDMSEGAPFVQGTPTFIVLHAGQGQIIPGALPLETFQEVLDEVVAQAESGESE